MSKKKKASYRKVIAFDPAQVFGVAWSDDGLVVPERSCVWNFVLITDPGLRYISLFEHLRTLPYDPPEFVVYEDSRGHSGRATEWCAGYRAVVQMWAAMHGALFMRVAPNTLKKWATGRGSATKAQRATNPDIEKDRMRAAALKQWPEHAEVLSLMDENRIDAQWALAWGLEQIHK